MTEQREQCCGNCWWWVKYRSREGGWCFRDGSARLPSDSCSRWESYFTTWDKTREEHDNDC